VRKGEGNPAASGASGIICTRSTSTNCENSPSYLLYDHFILSLFFVLFYFFSMTTFTAISIKEECVKKLTMKRDCPRGGQ
jgi:hypothetical protein